MSTLEANSLKRSNVQGRNVVRSEDVENTMLEGILDLGSIMNLSDVEEP